MVVDGDFSSTGKKNGGKLLLNGSDSNGIIGKNQFRGDASSNRHQALNSPNKPSPQSPEPSHHDPAGAIVFIPRKEYKRPSRPWEVTTSPNSVIP